MIRYIYCVALAAMIGAPAAAATFTFNSAGPDVSSLAFSGGGVSGVITASATGFANGGPDDVTQNANGLGIAGGRIDFQPEIDGFVGLETLTVTFDNPVFLTSITAGSVGEDDSYDLLIDGALFTDEVNPNFVNPLVFSPQPLISSFGLRADALDDAVTLAAFTVAPVPVPAALPLLAAGLGALVVAARRRTA